MERFKITASQALEILAGAAPQNNTHIHQVAAVLVATRQWKDIATELSDVSVLQP